MYFFLVYSFGDRTSYRLVNVFAKFCLDIVVGGVLTG